jgi:hypothetical protein
VTNRGFSGPGIQSIRVAPGNKVWREQKQVPRPPRTYLLGLFIDSEVRAVEARIAGQGLTITYDLLLFNAISYEASRKWRKCH